jgi:hypothetical protein
MLDFAFAGMAGITARIQSLGLVCMLEPEAVWAVNVIFRAAPQVWQVDVAAQWRREGRVVCCDRGIWPRHCLTVASGRPGSIGWFSRWCRDRRGVCRTRHLQPRL